MTELPFRRLNIEEINYAIALYLHLVNHEEIRDEDNSHQYQPMCKICNITVKEILERKLYEKITKAKTKIGISA